MSNLFSSILTGAIKDFDTAASAIDTVWQKAVTAFPFLKTDADAAVSALKQQASNAFAFVDTELSPKYADATSMAESAADTLVMSLTHGVALPALPILNVGITQGFALLHAALDHAEAEAKAKFNLPAPTSASPTLSGLGSAVTSSFLSGVAAVTSGGSASSTQSGV